MAKKRSTRKGSRSSLLLQTSQESSSALNQPSSEASPSLLVTREFYVSHSVDCWLTHTPHQQRPGRPCCRSHLSRR